MHAKQVVEKWVEAFNRGNANEMAEFYHDDAVNHQVTRAPIEGKDAIRQMFEDDFAQADMVCIVENIFEDAQWSILEWRDPLGMRGCGFFRVIDEKIAFQRGYWDRLTFLRIHNLPVDENSTAGVLRSHD